jgi:hypothetical protein
MPQLSEDGLYSFVLSLAARCEVYTRNKIKGDKTGKESVIPVSDNRKVADELHQQIDELCVAYLKASDEEREYIRELVRDQKPLLNGLWRHIGWAVQNKPPDWVRRALAAASIEDNRMDFRDTFVALGQLYLGAVENGQDASQCFKEIALLSSATPGPFFPHSMRDFLAHFEQSAFFRQSIQSRLPRGGQSKGQ